MLREGLALSAGSAVGSVFGQHPDSIPSVVDHAGSRLGTKGKTYHEGRHSGLPRLTHADASGVPTMRLVEKPWAGGYDEHCATLAPVADPSTARRRRTMRCVL